MKKISIICLSLVAGLTASAQMDLVKDVESIVKSSSPNYSLVIEKITPAFTNPESKDNAQTWYVAGKAEFGLYDNLYAKRMIGQEADGKEMGNALINGYKYMMTALPLDAVVDAKGKVKTKYTKDIIKEVVAHYEDFDKAARILWEAEDYNGAYEAWEIFLNMPNETALGKDAPKADPDSVACEVIFNQALAAWQANDLEKAMDAFNRSHAKGYDKKQLYDYAISVAVQMEDNDEMYRYAEMALPLYGQEDPKYYQLLINRYIENQDYATADKMLKEAIANDPNNAQYYNLMGVLYESQGDKDNALECYRKAVAIDSEWAPALYNLGRLVCDKAFDIKDNLPGDISQAQYAKIQREQIEPLFKEASQYLEKAYSLDEQNMGDAIRYLKNIYYNLNDEENFRRVENL